MAPRRVTVFGGSGFVGRYLVERLADRDDVVTVAVRDPEHAKFLLPLGNVGQIARVRCPVQSDDAVAAVLENADAAVNLVGILSERGRRTFQAIHVDGAARIGRCAAASGVGRLVHVSAIGASLRAPSRYGRSKADGEFAICGPFPGATILRPSVMFGAEDGFLNLFAGLARLLPALPLYGGGRTRFQPVFAGDVAAAIVAALDDPATAGQTYELGGPHTYSFAELMRYMLRETGRRRCLLPVPFAVGRLQAAAFAFMPRPWVTVDQLRQLTVDNVVADGARTLHDLGIAPTTLETIAPTYLATYRRHAKAA